MEAKQSIVVAIDAGDVASGIVVFRNNQIVSANNTNNEEIFDLIKQYNNKSYRLRVVIEDVAAYSMQISPQIIKVCKWIGEMEYRLKTARIAFKMIYRSQVKTWVFNNYPDVAIPMIEDKIAKKGSVRMDGSSVKPSHVYVDDRIIKKAMEVEWSVEYQRVGRKINATYGLREHSWQALGLGTMYLKAGNEYFLELAKKNRVRIAAKKNKKGKRI
jgi:hypothetical protein